MDTSTQSDKKPMSRRGFIIYAWIAAAAVVVGELIGGTFAFLWPRRKRGQSEKIFVAGKANDYKIGEVVTFRRERTFIVRFEEGFLAMSSICPHLHCIVSWNEMIKEFECPCHGGKFNKSGEVLAGPPPRPLDLHKLEIAKGNLVVDLESVVERKKFDPSQLVRV
jgi:nitrite reductase/ring-hydroxylating ferredoxin subunit